MHEHNFQLTISGSLTDDRLDALFEAGCDDATFSSKGGHTFADFDRDAPTLLDAVTSAIADVESVAGLEVLHIEPDELVWAAEIAERTGRTRQNVDQLVRGQRGPGGFPPPASHATRNPLWRWSDVEAWFASYEGRDPETERALVVSGLNGALQARHSLRGDPAGAKGLREALKHLLAS